MYARLDAELSPIISAYGRRTLSRDNSRRYLMPVLKQLFEFAADEFPGEPSA